MDYDEKITYFEETVKKREIPKEILNKERLVTASCFAQMQKNSFNGLKSFFSYENKAEESVDEAKSTVIEDSLESIFPLLASRTSNFLLSSGVFVVSFLVDQGNGLFFESKSVVHKQLDSSNTGLSNIMKELDWL